MKKRQKITSLLLALALLLGPAACGPDDYSSSQGNGAAGDGEISQAMPEDTPDYIPEESAPLESLDPWEEMDAMDSPEYQLQELMRYAKDLPDQIWWLNEENFRSLFGATGKIFASCQEPIRFESTLETSLEIAKLYGITEEEWALRDTGDWPYGLWEGQSTWVVLSVTARPQEEPPEAFTHEGLEFQPVEGHPEYERFVPDWMKDGQPISVQLRWQREGFWFFVQIPAHLQESFLENQEGLWRKVPVDRSMAQEVEESAEVSSRRFDPLESGAHCSHFEATQSVLDREVAEGWLDGYFWPSREEMEKAFPLDKPDSLGTGGIDDYLIDLELSCSPDLDQAAAFYGVTREELSQKEMKTWPWSRYSQLAFDYRFWCTGRPVEGDVPLPHAWSRWEEDKSYIDQLKGEEGMLPGPAWAEEDKAAPTPPPADREPLDNYAPPEFQEAEGHPGTEIAVVETAPNGNPLQVRLRWRQTAKNGGEYVFMAQIPGYALESFWVYQNRLFQFQEGPASSGESHEAASS